MKTTTLIPLCFAFLIAIIEGIALFKGVNGRCLALTLAIIGGLGGYGLREVIELFKRK